MARNTNTNSTRSIGQVSANVAALYATQPTDAMTTVIALYRCQRHNRTIRRVFTRQIATTPTPPHIEYLDEAGAVAGMYLPMGRCPVCKTMLAPYPVRGTLSVGRICNDACQNAITPRCSCSCAGAQHGAAWSA